MWDSLTEHITVIVALLIALSGLVGWLIRFLLKKTIFDRFSELDIKIVESEARMTHLVTQRTDALDVRVADLEKKFDTMRVNYLDRFQGMHEALNDTREEMIRTTGETSAAILKAVMELRAYITDNFQKVKQ